MFKHWNWQRGWAALMVVCGLLCGLVACGSGGGDDGNTSSVQPPKITTEPASVTVPAGANATFSVVASGDGTLAYQWLRNSVAITGATSSSYTTAATVDGDNGALFSVRVTNSAGAATSTQAMLTVTRLAAAPTITAGPADATVAEGQTASFSVQASSPGSAASYQWRRNGEDIAGATAASYSTGSTSAADQGAAYTVVVSNATGSTVGGPALLTVNSPPRVTAAPQNASHFVGETARFSVTASGTAPFTYSWLRNGVALAGANAASFTTPALDLADHGARYSVQVGNAFGRVLSTEAVLAVAPVPLAPAISTQPQDTTVQAGTSATFSVTASGSGPLGYQWFKNGSAIAGATAASYTTPVLAWTDTLGGYSVAVSNRVGSTTSRTAQLTVTPRVTQVVAGGRYTAVRKEDGSVWSMGQRELLGAGPGTAPAGTPVRAMNPNGTVFNQVQALVAGNNHAMALKSDGSLWSWGYGDLGQLGNGTSGTEVLQAYPTPVLAAAGTAFGNVAQASGGINYSLAVKADGSAWGWGYNVSARVGNNPSSQASVLYPVQVLTSPTAALGSVKQIAAHDDHGIALKTDGTAWVWGSGVSGRLGNGIRNSSSSVAVPLKDSLGNAINGIQQVAVGGSFGMVLLNDGTAYGFGENQFGELGDGSNQERLWATLVKDNNANAFGNVTALRAGRTATAFLRADGTVWMTGRNLGGVLARPLATGSLNLPVQVLMADGRPLDQVVQLAFTQETVVVLRQDGTVWGWGENYYGQLGTTAALTPGCTCAAVPVLIPVGR